MNQVFQEWLKLGHAAFMEAGDIRVVLAAVWMLPIMFVVVIIAWVCGIVNNWRRK